MINSADCVRLKMLLSTVRNREARKSSLDKKLCRKGWQLASKVHHFIHKGTALSHCASLAVTENFTL